MSPYSKSAFAARGYQDAGAVSDRLIGLPGVIAATGVSRTSIYRLLGAGEFPKPKRLSKRRVAWLASDVDCWINSRVAA